MSRTSSDRGRTGGGGTGRGRPADCWTGSRVCPVPRSRGRTAHRCRSARWSPSLRGPLAEGRAPPARGGGAPGEVPPPDGGGVVRARGGGDDALPASAAELVAAGPLLVVTADRGL